jgi:dienelactone hydrolase
MKGKLERRKTVTLATVVCLGFLLPACPPKLVSGGPKKGVVRTEVSFWNSVKERPVNTVVLSPTPSKSKQTKVKENCCPLVLLIPGFIDTSFGLESYGRELVQRGYYVVIPDPDDALNILPQGEESLFEAHFPELWASLRQLQADLAAIGYEVEADTAVEMLMWFYSSLDGSVTNPEALDLCQQVFDYRLTDAEAIINACLAKKMDLPEKQLIRDDCVFVAGHSLGGFTALELAGAGGWSNLPPGLVKAAVVMAPATGFFAPEDMAQIKVPTLWLKAGLDDPQINKPLDLLYPYVPEPKRFKEYPWFNHEDFSDTFRVIKGSDEVGLARQKKALDQMLQFFDEQYLKMYEKAPTEAAF